MRVIEDDNGGGVIKISPFCMIEGCAESTWGLLRYLGTWVYIEGYPEVSKMRVRMITVAVWLKERPLV